MSSIIQTIKNINKKTFIIIFIIILATIISIGLAFNVTRPYHINSVRSQSKNPGVLDIAWKDDEDDVVYTVYWSDKEGINVHNVETYRSHKQVIGRKTSIRVQYEFVYFRISKKNFVSREFMNTVIMDDSFCKKNLKIRVLRGNQKDFNSIEVKVLENAEIYRVYHYINSKDENTTFQQDYLVKNLTNAILKIPVIKNAMVFVSFLRNGYESELEFLWNSNSDDFWEL